MGPQWIVYIPLPQGCVRGVGAIDTLLVFIFPSQSRLPELLEELGQDIDAALLVV